MLAAATSDGRGLPLQRLITLSIDNLDDYDDLPGPTRCVGCQ